jgi:hypothetical protein
VVQKNIRNILAVLLLALLLVFFLVILKLAKEGHYKISSSQPFQGMPSQNKHEEVHVIKNGKVNPSKNPEPDITHANHRILGAEIPQVILPKGTMGELLKKGFPSISTPRNHVYEQTARQSLPEVVADLGNPTTMEMCRVNVYGGMRNNIGHWWDRLSRNVKIMRLIEEGRKRPEIVAPLVKKGIREALDSYDTVKKAALIEQEKYFKGLRPSATISSNDAYYNKNFKYKDPLFEQIRLPDVIYASFYILANLNQIDSPQLLAEWIQKEKFLRTDCKRLNVFLVDCYFKQPQVTGTSAAKQYTEITQGYKLSGDKVKQSSWKAAWDIHDFLLAARKVDVSDLPTIEVLEIPRDLKGRVPVTVQDNAIKYFLKVAHEATASKDR